jgi:hypothetical protein
VSGLATGAGPRHSEHGAGPTASRTFTSQIDRFPAGLSFPTKAAVLRTKSRGRHFWGSHDKGPDHRGLSIPPVHPQTFTCLLPRTAGGRRGEEPTDPIAFQSLIDGHEPADLVVWRQTRCRKALHDLSRLFSVVRPPAHRQDVETATREGLVDGVVSALLGNESASPNLPTLLAVHEPDDGIISPEHVCSRLAGRTGLTSLLVRKDVAVEWPRAAEESVVLCIERTVAPEQLSLVISQAR